MKTLLRTFTVLAVMVVLGAATPQPTLDDVAQAPAVLALDGSSQANSAILLLTDAEMADVLGGAYMDDGDIENHCRAYSSGWPTLPGWVVYRLCKAVLDARF